MKKIVLFVALLGIGFFANAQEKESIIFKQNEVKLNLPMAIFGKYLEVSYERILMEDLGVGANVGFSYAKEEDQNRTFQFLPYVNWYFNGSSESTKKYASGFFIQANTAITSQTSRIAYDRYNDTITEYPSSTNFGIGMGFGWKFVSRNNWTGVIYFGGGRNINTSSDSVNSFYGTGGLYIGKRF